MELKNPNQDYILSSVKNALRILRSFSLEEPNKKVTDLAFTLGLSKSTIIRLLLTLASEDFITQDPKTKRYRLGNSVFPLSSIASSQHPILKESTPYLHQLAGSLKTTVHFMALENTEVSFLFSVDDNHFVRYFTQIGKKSPAYCTSAGKVILAYQNAETVEKVVQTGLRPFTKKTMTDPQTFYSALSEIKTQGYSICEEEFQEGIVDMAAPVQDCTGQVFAAVSLFIPTTALTRKKISSMTKEIKVIGCKISEKLYQCKIKKADS